MQLPTRGLKVWVGRSDFFLFCFVLVTWKYAVYQSGTKPKQVIKKVTETSYFSSSLHQSKSVKFFLIKLKYAGFYIIKMLMGDAAR